MLSLKKKRFCEYYCGEAEGNIRKAAKLAGFSNSYSEKRACEFMKDPEVTAYIKELTKDGTDERIASINDIQRFWTKTMNDEDEPMKNRLRASELLAKTKGAFNSEW